MVWAGKIEWRKVSKYNIRFPKTEAGRQLSDHFPVSATFAFKK